MDTHRQLLLDESLPVADKSRVRVIVLVLNVVNLSDYLSHKWFANIGPSKWFGQSLVKEVNKAQNALLKFSGRFE